MENENIHIFEYLHLLRRRKTTLIVSFASVIFLVCLINVFQKAVYRTTAELVLEVEPPKIIMGTNLYTLSANDEGYPITQRRIIRSRPIAQGVVEQALANPKNLELLLSCFRLGRIKGGALSNTQREQLIARIQGAVDLTSIPRARIFQVTATGGNAEGVACLANTVSDVYMQYHEQSQISNSQQNFIAFTAKVQDLKNKLNISEFALQKVQLELKLVEMLKVYEEKHPEVVKMRDQIDNFSHYLKQELQRVRQSLGTDPSTREQREAILFSYLETDSARQGQGIEGRKSLAMFLEQEVNTNKDMYNTFFRKMEEIKLSDQSSSPIQLKMLERAGVPSKPIKPNRKLNLIFGCVVGITLGIGIAFFQDYLDNTIKTAEDVKKYLNLMMLGIIPALDSGRKPLNGNMSKGQGNALHRLMTLNDSNSQMAEAFRTMRTNILLASVDRPLRTLMVTSSVQKEGKSTTAINLAISIARAGSRVLLVDADLRRPVLAKTFNLEGKLKADLVDLLTGNATVDDAICPSGVENLNLLPTVRIPPNPSELLGSNRMKDIIENLRAKFELVIFDSPPLVAVTDSVVLSSRLDGTVFVAHAGKVPRALSVHAKTSLDNAKANILGAVLNNVHVDQSSYNYYHYYRYYRHYNSYTGTSPAVEEVTVSR